MSTVSVETTVAVFWNMNATQSGDFQPFASRLAEDVLAGMLIAVSSYLSVASALYQHANGHRNLKWTNRLCTIAAVSLLFEGCWFEFEIHGSMSDGLCQLYVVVSVVMLFFNKSFAYLVLWIRQRSFYNLPTVKISSKASRFFSSLILIGIVVFPLFQIALHLLHDIQATPAGCIALKSPSFVSVAIPVSHTLFVLFEVALLGLVLFPIAKYWRRRSCINRVKIVHLVVRLSVCTAVCVVTDLLFLIVSMHRPAWASLTYIPAVYSINAIINTIALYVSFADYRKRLTVAICHKISPMSNKPAPSTITTIH